MKVLTAEQRIVAGMAVLAEKCPDWLKKVNLDEFDMQSRESNLLAQLFGPVRSARKLFGVSHKVTLGQLGFRRMRWIYPHPTSKRARRRDKLEDETWEKVCELWPEIVRKSRELMAGGGRA